MSVAAAPTTEQLPPPLSISNGLKGPSLRRRRSKVLISSTHDIASVGGTDARIMTATATSTDRYCCILHPSPSQLFTPLGGHSFRWSNSSYIFPDGTTSIIKATSLYEGAFYAYLFSPLIQLGALSSMQLANLAQVTSSAFQLTSNQWKNRMNLNHKIKPSNADTTDELDLLRLREFIPRVHTIRVDDETNELLYNDRGGLAYDTLMRTRCYIEMENLVGIDPGLPDSLKPTYCAMDLKIGTRFWGLDAGKEKRERMNRKAEITTAAKTGLCLIAYKCMDSITGKISCQMTREETRRIKTVEELYMGLEGFFSLAPKSVIRMIKKEVEAIMELFRRQKVAHFYSSSLLIIYDSSGVWPMKVKLIDFEHASLYHFERDESFLTGLENFSNFLNTLDDFTTTTITTPIITGV